MFVVIVIEYFTMVTRPELFNEFQTQDPSAVIHNFASF